MLNFGGRKRRLPHTIVWGSRQYCKGGITYLLKIRAETIENFLLYLLARSQVGALLHAFKSLLLAAGEVFRDIDADIDDDVASSVAVAVAAHLWQSLAFQPHACARLSARLDADAYGVLQCGDFYAIAQRCLADGEEKIIDDVVGIADESVGRFFLNEHLDVARDAPTACCMALARHIENHALLYARRNIHFNHLFAADDAFSLAAPTLICDDGAFTLTSLAGHLLLHDAEDALRLSQRKALAMTVGTSLW